MCSLLSDIPVNFCYYYEEKSINLIKIYNSLILISINSFYFFILRKRFIAFRFYSFKPILGKIRLQLHTPIALVSRHVVRVQPLLKHLQILLKILIIIIFHIYIFLSFLFLIHLLTLRIIHTLRLRILSLFLLFVLPLFLFLLCFLLQT